MNARNKPSSAELPSIQALIHQYQLLHSLRMKNKKMYLNISLKPKLIITDQKKSEDQKAAQKVIFPLISQKCRGSISKKQESHRKSGRKKHQQGFSLLGMIEKELELEKREYFKTFSNKQALMALGSKSRKRHQSNYTADNLKQAREQMLMTPPFATSRKTHRQLGDVEMKLTHEKTISRAESPLLQQEYSPWEYAYSKQPDSVIQL